MMAGRSGQRRKSKIADEFDAFVRATSSRCKDWATAVDEDVLDWCCFLDSQGNGTTSVHVPSCPGVGLAHGSAFPPESGCAKRYAAQSMDKGFVFKLRMAFRQQLGKGNERDPV